MNQQTKNNSFDKSRNASLTARMLHTFDAAGSTLSKANFFGITLDQSTHGQEMNQIGVRQHQPACFGKPNKPSLVAQIMDAFATASLTLPEANFFGVTLSDRANRLQTNQVTVVQSYTFATIRQHSDQLRAA